jgi:tRNA pseudouridine(55) synthase
MPIYLYKSIGQTPNELINDYKTHHSHAKKVSFAGRLDPMAHGTMALLVNEECKLHDTYISKDKTYEFEILFGFKTDTFDVLGKLLEFNNPNEVNSSIETINLENYTKQFNQEYPPYSSIVVNKKPLWEWSKLGLIDTIKIPSKLVQIYEFGEIKYDNKIDSYEELQTTISTMINSLSETNKPKFRAEQILNLWNIFFKTHDLTTKPIIKKYRASVSSGTYIRSIANQIGNELGCGALALNIKRTIID